MFRRLSPAGIIIIGFLAVIAVGTVLLCMPFCSASGGWTSIIDALFTSVSATCVTGLTTVNTALHWSAVGKGIILLLIQVGGLGFMSLAMLFSLAMGRKVSPKEHIVFSQSLSLPGNDGLVSFLGSVFRYTFIFEGAGALLLSFRFIPLFGFGNGLCQSIFSAVSAYCNAGFDILPSAFAGEWGSISYFSGDWYVCSVVMLLIISGGLGFLVWREIIAAVTKREKLSLYSKLVLIISSALIISGFAVTLAAEYSNPDTLGNKDLSEKILCSLFQSVTYRTAGFNTMNLAGMHSGTKAFSMLLMFIGGSSGSTAGGVKTVTVGVLVIAVIQVLRGNKNFVLAKRTIDKNTIYRALAITNLAAIVVLASSFIVSAAEGFGFASCAFECFSAFGTVGITLGITSGLSVFSKLYIMCLMFFGRVGIATIAYGILMSMNRDDQCITYPRTNIIVG